MEEIKFRKKIVQVGGTSDGIRLTKTEKELYDIQREDIVEVIIRTIKRNDKTIKEQ